MVSLLTINKMGSIPSAKKNGSLDKSIGKYANSLEKKIKIIIFNHWASAAGEQPA